LIIRRGTDYKAGFLLGRLCVYGFFKGYYTTPEILVRPGLSAKETAERLLLWGTRAIDNRMLMARPTLLEYFDGTYGVQIPVLDIIAKDLITPITCKPLPALEKQKVKFLHGFLAGYAEAISEIKPKLRRENPDWSPVLVRLLQRTSKSKPTTKERT